MILSLLFFERNVSATSETTVSYNFDNTEELLDFSPFFVSNESGTNGSLEPFSDRWREENSQVISSKLASGNGSTGNIAFLTLNKYQFQNFEAEIVMNFVGDASWGWGGISFRQENVGNGWRADGCLAFVQKEGYATLWGSEKFDDTVFEGNKPTNFNKSTPFLLKVKVLNNRADVQVSNLDSSLIYSTVTKTFSKTQANYSGFISLASIDNSHAFDSLKITALNNDGNPTSLTPYSTVEKIEINSSVGTYSVGEEVTLETKVTPSNIPLDSLIWESNDPEVVIVKGGNLIAIKEGHATIKAYSPFNMDIKSEVSLIFTEQDEKPMSYIFNSASVLEDFTANYVRNDSDPLAGNEDFQNHWELTEDGTAIRTNLDSMANSDENISSLYLKGKTFSNFEATLIYRNLDDEYGWVGVSSGSISKTSRFMDDGQGLFVQREGVATIWGNKIGGPFEQSAPKYDTTSWHALKVRVVGKTVKMYVDDLINPVFIKTLEINPQPGEIGIFTSGRAKFEIKSFSVKYLSNEGDIIDIEEITTFKINNKITNANVGDKLSLEVFVEPSNSVDNTYSVSSTNGNICFYNGGRLFFIGEGEVTINVISNFDQTLNDSMTIKVTDKSSKEPIYYYIEPTPEEDQEKGCKFNSITLAIPSLVVILGLFFNRRRS
jgi:uncharacterized protein YjdB